MKRDLNICRDYLLDMAGEKDAKFNNLGKLHLYHTALLYDAGLIDKNYFLTMKGWDVVSLIRDDLTWDCIMSVSDKVGGLSFDMILEYAKESLARKVDKAEKDKEPTKTYNVDNSLNSFQPYIDAVNKINKLFSEMGIKLDDWKHDNDDSDFVKKELKFTPELDQRFNSQNVGRAIADAYLLAKGGRYESALLLLNFYMRTSIFSNNTIELRDNCADEIELLLNHILDNLPFN